jgi:exonuclease VII small subunit
LSELIEDALAAFERERVSDFEDSLAEAYHGWERRRKLKARARTKLTEAEREVLRL